MTVEKDPAKATPMVSPKALAQLNQILAKWEKIGKASAGKKFLDALEQAKAKIAEKPQGGTLNPLPYAEFKVEGRRWLREGAYWVSYSLAEPPVISGFFFVTSNEPKQG